MQIHSIQGYEREVKRLLGAHEREISAYALGLAGEVGEVVDLLKKAWGHGHPLDVEKLKKEIGDSMWYVVALALQFGIGVERITPRRLIDDIGPEHRGQRPLFLTTRVGRVNNRLLRRWFSEHGEFDEIFERRLARDLMQVFDQLEQLGLEHGLSLGSILQANVDKLRVRYPAGFSTEASIARVDVMLPGVLKEVSAHVHVAAPGPPIPVGTFVALGGAPPQTITEWHDSSCAPMDPSLDMS